MTRKPEPVTAPIAPPATVPSPANGWIDLSAAAAICTDISRVTSGDQVGVLLRRIASILDAPGVVVWMGAGEELFAAANEPKRFLPLDGVTHNVDLDGRFYSELGRFLDGTR